MTTNTVSSSTAAATVHAQQAATKHKSTVDFAKLMANAGGDIKTDVNSTSKTGSTTAIVQNGDGAKTTA
ncbi:hypothetical protein [Herbaspirillum sp. RV1423]|uniref:hypothetical protein n=1 Tax=Herbaspirillum sp. RV1423 TaxID=1443993 RepID=UPI0012DCBDCC|nr:hypothetical protein [Herbaspirillum sp. RV1423]